MKFTKLAVSKKEIFKVAHEITKGTVKKGDSYSVTFAAVLKEIYIAINDISSEFASKSIKSRLSCFFNQSNAGFYFESNTIEINPSDATTTNMMTDAQIEESFKKMSFSVINSIWDYMPFN